jgi:hypothetical protein
VTIVLVLGGLAALVVFGLGAIAFVWTTLVMGYRAVVG